jgi:hypothetical protein
MSTSLATDRVSFLNSISLFSFSSSQVLCIYFGG